MNKVECCYQWSDNWHDSLLGNSLYSCIFNNIDTIGNNVAIVDSDNKEYTYRDLLILTDKLACYFKCELNLKKGEQVAILMRNCIEFCVAYLALSKIGCVVVLLPSKYTKKELNSLIEKSDIHAILTDKYCHSKLNFEPKFLISIEFILKLLIKQVDFDDVNLNDEFVLMYTSGTTSKSKGVLLTNRNVMASIMSYTLALKISKVDKTIIPTPLYHVSGLICNLSLFLVNGGTVYIQDGVNPSDIIKCFFEKKITFFHSSPTVFHLLIDVLESERNTINSVKKFLCGSGNINPSTIRKIVEFIPNGEFQTVYGLTETSGAGTLFPYCVTKSENIGSSGIPMPGIELKIINDDVNCSEVSSFGEILIKGESVINKYYSRCANYETFDYLETGDVGILNDENYLFVMDRKKDMINKGGEKVCSFDVENAIKEFPGVLDVAVVGYPDPKYIEIVVALLRLSESTCNCLNISEDLSRFLLKRVAKYKIPDVVHIVKDIPKTNNGKVNKDVIRKRLRSNLNKFY